MADERRYGGYGRDWNGRRDDEYRSSDRSSRSGYGGEGRSGGYYGDQDRDRSNQYGRGGQSGYGEDDYGFGRSRSGDSGRLSGYEAWDRDYGSERYGGGSEGRGSDYDASRSSYPSDYSRGYGQGSYSGVDFDRSRSGSYRASSYGERSGSYDRDYGARTSRMGQSPDYGYGRDRDYSERGRGERGFMDRMGDEISSWFGDEDAARRREQDQRHSGKGPRSYTRSDDRIKDDVNDRLTDDHYVDASDIEVSVKDREVTLNGYVSSRDEKRRAEDCAERVSGVTHVQNNLRVQSSAGSTISGTGTAMGMGAGTSTGRTSGSSLSETGSATGTSSALGTTKSGTSS
ncbi:BON domain-containing protein [Antarcticirhabdus aurantiaca]|uniref:BON domain-containing protein n=1 Tax=Antarcticirhabdus aurantiaca TaxID=2606717 RepID=A0ACD4NRW1_9HYPH|nr:BON domain-containing protein [Antarcticirhabdus aurantiaca]WAJ29457.1 BON domain-containing protein [Jeongeuplla avenae]